MYEIPWLCNVISLWIIDLLWVENMKEQILLSIKTISANKMGPIVPNRPNVGY